MAQVSRRVRRERRLKRERSQLRKAIGIQQAQMQNLVKMTIEARTELKNLKDATAPMPKYTIRTISEDTNDSIAVVDSNPS